MSTTTPTFKIGRRAEKLRSVIKKAALQSMKSCNHDAFARGFSGFAQAEPEQFRESVQKLQDEFQDRFISSLEQIWKQRDLDAKLARLDQVENDALSSSATLDSITPANVPQKVMADRVKPLRKQALMALKEKLETIKEENRQLIQEIRLCKQNMKENQALVDNVYQDLSQATQNLSLVTPLATTAMITENV